MSDLISTLEAAEILGVKRATITRWVRIGELKPVQRIHGDRAFLFRRSQIERLKTRRQGLKASA